MLVYDFEVLKDEALVASMRSIRLPDVGATWTMILALAKSIDEPGHKIRVKDQAGGIVILIGIVALRHCADTLSQRNRNGTRRFGSLPFLRNAKAISRQRAFR
jgi:hypothetical protein